MRQHLYVLPVRCENCKGVFDLWYDLQASQSEEDISSRRELGKVLHQSLCWRCRKTVLRSIRDEAVNNAAIVWFTTENISDAA